MNPSATGLASNASVAEDHPLSWLLGKWEGLGAGEYPTIKPFSYLEQLDFHLVGKHVMYTQHTFHPEKRKPMHSETGIIRALSGSKVEFLIAQVSGITEVDEGVLKSDEKLFDVSSSSISRTATTTEPRTTAVRRVYWLDKDGCLAYKVYMATTRTPDITLHLTNVLKRIARL